MATGEDFSSAVGVAVKKTEEITYKSHTHGKLFLPYDRQSEEIPVQCGVYIEKLKDSFIEMQKKRRAIVSDLRQKYFVDDDGSRVSSEDVVKVNVFPEVCPTKASEEAEFKEYKRKHPEERVGCLLVRNPEGKLRFVRVPTEHDRVVTHTEYSAMLKPRSNDEIEGPIIRILNWVSSAELLLEDIGRGDSYYICATGMETIEEGKIVKYYRKGDVNYENTMKMNIKTFQFLLTAMKREEKGAFVSYRFRQGLDDKYYVCTPCAEQDGWMIMIPFPVGGQRNVLRFPKLPAADPTLVASFEELIKAKEMGHVEKDVLQKVETSAASCRGGRRQEFTVPATEDNIRLLLTQNPDDATRESLQEMLDSKHQQVLPDGTIDPESGDPVKKAVHRLCSVINSKGLGPR